MGEITWKFLKPLIRGKILYTPKNKVTRVIIGKVSKILLFFLCTQLIILAMFIYLLHPEIKEWNYGS